MRKIILILAIFALITLPAYAGYAATSANPESETENGLGATGMRLPRFAALRSDNVNMRTGPGTRYPIEWVFHRKGLPVEIIAEYEVWRRVRDPDGAVGWVHKSALSGKRAGIVSGAAHELHKSDDVQSVSLAHLEPGVIGQLIACKKDWCQLKFDTIKGYMHKGEFWGAYPNETFD